MPMFDPTQAARSSESSWVMPTRGLAAAAAILEAAGAGTGEDLLKTAAEEHVLARLLTELMDAYVERDDPERAFWCSSSLSGLDAACIELSSSTRRSSGDATI